MISFLNGEIRNIFSEKSVIEIDVSGVGYEVSLPKFVLDEVINNGKKNGEKINLEIYYHATERSPKPLLVGFNNHLEKLFFEKIIQVEGVGPLKAVSALIFPVAIVSQAIEDEDISVLNQMPGIGARAAQKMIATLKGKLIDIISESRSSLNDADSNKNALRDDIVEILVGLGFKESDAIIKINEVISEKPELKDNLEEIIREIFKSK
ncbi:MAG: Holliday junction DNA helicase RuvA [Chloroflexi bacterium]|nr:Holliday junction DNA helicase RuvA [Chloroflexota bacterium]|tara:strand:+ start:52 stop:675 length:624 start_codon:yes stop_codon:yes gene_type:complete